MIRSSFPPGETETIPPPALGEEKKSPRRRWVDAQGRFLGKIHLLDLLAVGFVLSFLPLIPFGYRVVKGSSELLITTVSPGRITAGPNQVLTILGTGFDHRSTIQIGSLPPQGPVTFQDASLYAMVPPDISPGKYRIAIRNGRGRMVFQEDSFEVLWKPQIEGVGVWITPDGKTVLDITGNYFEKGCSVTCGDLLVSDLPEKNPQHLGGTIPFPIPPGKYLIGVKNENGLQTIQACDVTMDSLLDKKDRLSLLRDIPSKEYYWRPSIHRWLPEQIKSGDKTGLIVTGEFFGRDCQVSLGKIPLPEIQYVSSSCLLVRIPAQSIPPGRYPLSVKNHNGLEAISQGFVEVTSPPLVYMTSVVVILRFEGLTKQMVGWLEDQPKPDPNDGTSIGKVVHVLGKQAPVGDSRASRRSMGGWVLAQAVLSGEMERMGKDLRFIYQGQEVSQGKKIVVRIPPGSSVNAKVLSRPIELGKLMDNSKWDDI